MVVLKITSFTKNTAKHLFCKIKITFLGHVTSYGRVILLIDSSNIKSPIIQE